MPYSVVILASAGLIPFIALLLSALLNWLPIYESARYFTQYSAVLLSFFGGIYWWDAIQKNTFDRQVYVAMLPTIIGWLCLVFSGNPLVLGILSMAYLFVLYTDKQFLALSKARIVSYIAVRMAVTTGVVLCHAGMIFVLN